MEAGHQCRHKTCRNETKNQRKPYTTPKARNLHERELYHHPCSVEDGCATCVLHEGKRRGKPIEDSRLVCRHEQCCRYYSNPRSRESHERDHHECTSSCNRCALIRGRKKRKRDHELREEEEQRLTQERKRQRIERTARALEQINSVPWEAMAQEHLEETESEHLRAQVRVLLEIIYGSSFEECLSEILKADPRVITRILADTPALKELSHQPNIDTLLALKDELRVPDHAWPLVCAVFRLGRNGSIHTVRQHRTEINAVMPTVTTPGHSGSAIPLIKFIEWLIVCNPEALNKMIQVVAPATRSLTRITIC